VQASNAEKGPFTELCSGPLTRTDPLAITIYDEAQAVCRLTMLDFAAQASIALSPTAGWGVPCNAIEFHLLGNQADDYAFIYVTLAATSVGRGWDSVGHAAGVYNNRLQFESLAQPAH